MRVEDSNKSKKVEKASAKAGISDRSDGSLFASILSASEEEGGVGAAVLVSGVNAADAIFATQVAEDATSRKARNRRAAKQGEDLLDKLEKIKLDIVSGEIPKDDLIALGQTLRTRRENDLDPKLEAILDEIELRVEVELAKVSRDTK